ncbi:hypothetical protein TNCV_4157251 [Trichonephila clavipes]|nr:hypothetical protein TNCV_4157251 [Trichonephila clavipes]
MDSATTSVATWTVGIDNIIAETRVCRTETRVNNGGPNDKTGYMNGTASSSQISIDSASNIVMDVSVAEYTEEKVGRDRRIVPNGHHSLGRRAPPAKRKVLYFSPELLDSHNQSLTIDELIEMHEQAIEELDCLDPVQSEDRTTGSEKLTVLTCGISPLLGISPVIASNSRPEGLGSMPDATKYPPSTHGVRTR